MTNGTTKPGRNLIVCGLPQSIGADQLRTMFSDIGAVASTKVMIDVKAGGHRGFGFVLFEDAADAARALATFDGKPAPGDPSKILHVEFAHHDAFNVVTDTQHIFVRNVPPTCTNVDVTQYFNQFGEVVSCALRQEVARPGQPSSIAAFVEFKDVKSAKDAVTKATGSTPFEDKSFPLLVKFAETSDIRLERRMRQKAAYADNSAINANHTASLPPPPMPAMYTSQGFRPMQAGFAYPQAQMVPLQYATAPPPMQMMMPHHQDAMAPYSLMATPNGQVLVYHGQAQVQTPQAQGQPTLVPLAPQGSFMPRVQSVNFNTPPSPPRATPPPQADAPAPRLVSISNQASQPRPPTVLMCPSDTSFMSTMAPGVQREVRDSWAAHEPAPLSWTSAPAGRTA